MFLVDNTFNSYILATGGNMPKQITLPEYLKETGLKQMKIAELIGVTKETLSLYCRGNITPGVNVLRKIEEATGGRVGLYSKWGEELKQAKAKDENLS